MLGVVITLIAILVLAYLVVKNYYPPISLLLIGLVLLFIAWCMGVEPVAANKSTHFFGFDIVEAFSNVMQSRMGGLGLNIMSIAGFSMYMDKIGASKALVKLCVKPLQRISSPYVLLALTYVVGQFIALFVNSAVGLGLLLMTSIYPLLLALGASRLSAAAVIATTCCLDIGPGSSNVLKAADVVNVDAATYFVKGQGPVVLCVVVAVAISHYFVQRWFDRREAAKGEMLDDKNTGIEHIKPEEHIASGENINKALEGAGPAYYAILPTLPLFLLLIFSPMVYKPVDISLVTSIFVSIIISLVVDIATRRKFKECCKDSQAIFEGMGKVFTSTVSLIVCAELFALGLEKVGGISTMIEAASHIHEAGTFVMMLVMLGIMTIAAIVTGSGNAAFFAFSPLLPQAASEVGLQAMALTVPVQLSASIARTMSPIAGVIIAISGISGVTPFQLIKRTIPVMIVALIVTVIASMIFL